MKKSNKPIDTTRFASAGYWGIDWPHWVGGFPSLYC